MEHPEMDFIAMILIKAASKRLLLAIVRIL